MPDPKYDRPKSTEDFKVLLLKLLRHIRGEQTQKEMDAKLSLDAPLWHKWESGYKNIKWKDFSKIAQTFKLPLIKTLDQILGHESNSDKGGKHYLNALRLKFANLNIEELATQLQITPSKARRIVFEDQEIDFHIILHFLGVCTQQLPFFLNGLFPGWESSNFTEWAHSTLKQPSLEAKYPWLCSIEALLVIKSYRTLPKHSSAWIAEELDLSEEQVNLGLDILQKNRSIELVNGKYVLNRGRVDMESGTIEDSAHLAQYWTDKSASRFKTFDGVPSSRKGWSYRIFPISKRGQKLIRAEVSEFYGNVHKIIAAESMDEKEQVHVLMLHSYDMEEFKS